MIPPVSSAHAPPDPRDAVLRARAQELEGQFLAEMLRHAGAGATPETFGGGVGEDQFASFLREAQAQAIVRRGGIGLAEHLFNALKGRADVEPR
ncbi:MAG: rod-binding protein [Rhodobacterales bacterium]|nr:rod-binding protein [Rhodobacterales bacterium]MDX5501015.1 rod-binding protein [Rhodobacterales bacterium]